MLFGVCFCCVYIKKRRRKKSRRKQENVGLLEEEHHFEIGNEVFVGLMPVASRSLFDSIM